MVALVSTDGRRLFALPEQVGQHLADVDGRHLEHGARAGPSTQATWVVGQGHELIQMSGQMAGRLLGPSLAGRVARRSSGGRRSAG